MNLYRLNEVPDPDGQLADLLDELIDNGALVELVGACGLDMTRLVEVGAKAAVASRWGNRMSDYRWDLVSENSKADYRREVRAAIDAVFGVLEATP